MFSPGKHEVDEMKVTKYEEIFKKEQTEIP